MSYTNSTTHYSIPLPTETDLVNGLDWNTSSELIDSAIYEASEAAGTASRDITAIKATIANLQDADVHFQQDLNEATGRIATLEQNAGKDEQDIQDLADMITDKEVAQAQSDVHVNVGEWFRYNGVLYVCTVEINIDDTIIPNTNCRATNIEDEMPHGGSIDAEDVDYNNQTSQLSATDVQTAIDELKGLIDAIPTGGGSMPILDYANPLATINSTTSYTVVSDCYITGVIGNAGGSSGVGKLTIDGTDVASVTNTSGTGDSQYEYIAPLAVKAGSVISVTGSGSVLHAFSEVS